MWRPLFAITVSLLVPMTGWAEEAIFVKGAELKVEGTGGGEGPAWHPELGVLMSGNDGQINRLDRMGKITIHRKNAGTNGLLFDAKGRLLACEPEQRRVTRTELDGKITVLTEKYDGKRYNQPNDITVDSLGRIYFSDPCYGDRKHLEMTDAEGKIVEGVYCIDPDGKVLRIIGRELERPNGVLVSADDKYLFVADNNNNVLNGARKLYRFDLKKDGTVELSSKKLLYDWGEGRGPDGIKQDAKGRLYVAGGLNKPNPPFEPAKDKKGGIYVLDPDGKLLDFLPVPKDEVTNCAFGSEDKQTLYITGGGTLYSIRTTTPGRLVWPNIDKTDLFSTGKDGYALYRIPGLVTTSKGTLLAYCEARKTSGNDWDTIDIMLRRSTDGGKTWEERQKIADVPGPHRKNPASLAQKLANPDSVTYNNPVAFVDRKHGLVHFLFCLEYMRCFYMKSDDDGKTFSKPVEITETLEKFQKDYKWKACATGPAHGIQLSSGRLVVPVWLSTGEGGNAHRPSIVSTIYSDDAGKTWQRGEIAADNTPDLINPNESVIAELTDGRVMLNIRSESKAHRRAVSFSKDGATGWTKPVFDEALLEPICMSSLVRFSDKTTRLLFANPHNLDRAGGKAMPGVNRDRKNLSVKLSYDEGKTWPVNKVLEPGFSGYSDLAVGPDGMIYCFYERGSTDGKNIFRTGSLCLARFNLEWLTDGKDTAEKK